MDIRTFLDKENYAIASKIESNFGTIINAYGCHHKQDLEYNSVCGQVDGSDFSWVCYFVITC
ncbi:MAG: hypothetical protein ACI976_001215 [Aureispira sp.]|jgi:hypothetical protein